MFRKYVRPLLMTAACVCAVLVSSQSTGAPGEKTDTSATAHYDTILAAGSFGDTVHFGFLADQAVVCVPATSSATVEWYGRGGTLQSRGAGTSDNRRAGKSTFVSTAFTPPASTCYSYSGSALLRGVIIGGTWTGNVLIIADRVSK